MTAVTEMINNDLDAHRGAILDGCPEHVSSRKVAKAVLSLQLRGLRTLATARGTCTNAKSHQQSAARCITAGPFRAQPQ